MSIQLNKFTNNNRKIINTLENFSVIEHEKDMSVSMSNAVTEYYMSKMGVKRRQIMIQLNGTNSACIQSGAMQWMAGNIVATSGIKGASDFLGKLVKSSITKESAVKPEYKGSGLIVLEPTYKYIILQNVSDWGQGMVVEDGMFLACDGSVQQNIVSRNNVSSALVGGEGFFNLCLQGSGVVALESNVPFDELIEVNLNNDTLKIDGSLAVCWSSSLDFTVESTTKSIIGSAASGEGLVNVYRGTGKILMSPVAPTNTLYNSTTTTQANAAKVAAT